MNSPDLLTPWLAPFGWLALEVTVVVLVALAAQPLLRTAAARRSLWRAALLALVAVLAAELTGTGSQLPAQLRLAWQSTFPALVPTPRAPAPEEFPITPALSFPLARISGAGQGEGAVPAPELLQLESPPPRSLSHSPTLSPAPSPWPAFLWLTGLAALLARSAWTHAGFAWLRFRHFFPAAEALRERVQALAARLGLRRRVRVLASERLRAPAAFGWLRPGVAVPGDFTDRFAPAQQDVMLAHELAHLAARDPLWQLLADLVTAALWWHPLAWVARRQHRIAGELAADDASLALPNGPIVLAECLLVLGHEAADCPRAALGMAGFRSQLGRRIERLLALPSRDWQAPSRARLALQTAVALLALAALALLPGCAANRTAGEAPFTIVTKWWQAKKVPVGDDVRSLQSNTERGTRNTESSQSLVTGSAQDRDLELAVIRDRLRELQQLETKLKHPGLKASERLALYASAGLKPVSVPTPTRTPANGTAVLRHTPAAGTKVWSELEAAKLSAEACLKEALRSDKPAPPMVIITLTKRLDAFQRALDDELSRAVVEFKAAKLDLQLRFETLEVEARVQTAPVSQTLVASAAPNAQPVVLQGRVLYHGTPPAEREIPLPAPVFAARTNAPLKTRFHRVSPDGGLADVVVYVKAGLPKQTYAVPDDELVVRADHYEFQPYIGAVQVGQRIRWESFGTSATSVHPAPTNTANPEFSRALMQHHPFVSKFTAPEHFLRVKVDVFPWMMHYVSVFEHPYFAVTDAEGRFRFPQPLPPGKYTLAAVHRRAGEAERMLDLTQSLPASAAVPSVEFRFNAPPGGATPPSLASVPQRPATPPPADLTPSVPPTHEELLERKARVQAEIKAMEKVFLATHPKMVGMRKQLESIEEALKQTPPVNPGAANPSPQPSPLLRGREKEPEGAPLVAADLRSLTSPQTPDAKPQTPAVSQSLLTSAATPVQLAAASPKGVTLPVPNPYFRTNAERPFLTHSSKGAQLINRKLDQIVLPEIHFDGVPLKDVVKRLADDAKQFDPEKKGLNFLINDVNRTALTVAPALDPSGNPIPAAQPVPLSETLVHLSLPLKGLTLREALDAICKTSEGGAGFTVEEYAVAFIPRGPGASALFSRTFRVSPDAFMQGLQGVVTSPVLGVQAGQPAAANGAGGQQPAPAGSVGAAGPVRAVVPPAVPAMQNNANSANALIRQFFQSAGVSGLGAPNSGTRVQFNPQTGALVVQGTVADLRAVEQAIQRVQPGTK